MWHRASGSEEKTRSSGNYCASLWKWAEWTESGMTTSDWLNICEICCQMQPRRPDWLSVNASWEALKGRKHDGGQPTNTTGGFSLFQMMCSFSTLLCWCSAVAKKTRCWISQSSAEYCAPLPVLLRWKRMKKKKVSRADFMAGLT